MKKMYYCISIVMIGLGLSSIYRLSSKIVIGSGKYFIQNSQKISVDDPRPVKASVQSLERQLKAVITYEDPPYVYKGDVIDRTSAEWKKLHPTGPKALDPRGGSLELIYNYPLGSVSKHEIVALIQRILDSSSAKNYPGRFKIVNGKDIFHVIPVQIRGASGQLVTVSSMLDTKISYSKQERSLLSTIELIVQEISRIRGRAIAL